MRGAVLVTLVNTISETGEVAGDAMSGENEHGVKGREKATKGGDVKRAAESVDNILSL